MPRSTMKQLDAIKKVLVDSLERNFVPFPVDKSICSAWTKSLPHGGETVIYTSFMYQLSGLFRSYEKHLHTFANLGGSMKLASIGKVFMKPVKKDLERGYSILRNISSMLEKAGIIHGYLYDDEPYSGGLLLELGMLDEFREYGIKMLKLLEEMGVKRVITVDPHTTNALRRLKEMLKPELDVVNYLTLIREAEGKGEFVLHDPCLYSRYDTLGDRIRELLNSTQVELKEDRMVTGKEYGTCCGGPLGPVDIDLSERIARNRAGKLLSVSKNVLVACPLCYQNLSPHVPGIRDLAEVIS